MYYLVQKLVGFSLLSLSIFVLSGKVLGKSATKEETAKSQ